jgi:hypothetical protein
MLLAVSGIVQATPSFATVEDEISVPVATRWLSRSPLADGHGGAAIVPEVLIASLAIAPTSASVTARYTRIPAPAPGNFGRFTPTIALATAHKASAPPTR